jgi:hypothetical protein
MTLAGILLTITLSLASCNFNGNSNNSKWNDIEEVKSNLNGTIWTHTSWIDEEDTFKVWCKLVFQNDKLY